ncbi:MAG: RNA polymerase sigma factor [Myxococcota bacterium]
MAAPSATEVEATDEELLGQLEGGNGAAFDVLYERYYSRVYNFLSRRLGNRADVEETTQEVFFNLVSSLHTFRRQAPFGAWVFGITRRTLANRFKKRRIDSIALSEAEMEAIPAHRRAHSAAGDDPLEAYECAERLARLQSAAGDLSPEQRQLFEMHHLQFHSIQEISRRTRRSEDSIKSHLYRTRQLLMA